MRQNIGPQICPTYKYVTSHGKRSSINVIKIKELTIGEIVLDCPSGTQCNHASPWNWKRLGTE